MVTPIAVGEDATARESSVEGPLMRTEKHLRSVAISLGLYSKHTLRKHPTRYGFCTDVPLKIVGPFSKL